MSWNPSENRSHICNLLREVWLAKGLNVDLIKKAFDYYDKVLFNHEISTKLKSCGVVLLFDTQTRKTAAGDFKGMKTNPIIRINLSMINSINPSKETRQGGIKANNPLEALLLVLEHELVHLMMYLWKSIFPETLSKFFQKPHSKLFKFVLKELFGHTSITHEFIESSGIVSKNSTDFKRGDAVQFTYNSEIKKGFIVRINKKSAGIRLEDGKEWRVGYCGLQRIFLPPPKENIFSKPNLKMKFSVGDRVFCKTSKGDIYRGVVAEIKITRIVVHVHTLNGLNFNKRLLFNGKYLEQDTNFDYLASNF